MSRFVLRRLNVRFDVKHIHHNLRWRSLCGSGAGGGASLLEQAQGGAELARIVKFDIT